jgi:protein-tyrosine phosphatase
MGNICRSPLAEGVFVHQARSRGVHDRFDVDSAGTGGWHAGNLADARMREVAAAHDITLTSRARQVRGGDFEAFDLIVCMDGENYADLLERGAPAARTHLLLAYDSEATIRDVPDPYFGGRDGFHEVYRLVDTACARLLEHLLAGGRAPGATDRADPA